MRVPQPKGDKGSLKWIQQFSDDQSPTLETPILEALSGATAIEWLSPRSCDEYAEYRDGEFLEVLGIGNLRRQLTAFWRTLGPQWDALARTNAGHVLLIEAKAHPAEFCSPGSQASTASRTRIEASLHQVATELRAQRADLWAVLFYQYANRLAHLWFLHEHGVDARLVLVGFVGDTVMNGPSSPEAWEAAYVLADYVLGLPKRHALTPYIIHVHPTVSP